MPTLASYPHSADDWATICRWIDEHRPDLADALALDAPTAEQLHPTSTTTTRRGLRDTPSCSTVVYVRYTTEHRETDSQPTDPEGTVPQSRPPRQDGHQHAA